MAVKNAVAKTWGMPARADGKRYSLPDVSAPPAPGNPAAVAASDTEIVVNCDESVDLGSTVTEYRIYVGTVDGGPYALYVAIPLNLFPYTVTGLEPETTYYFKITAVNAFGRETALGSCTQVSDTTDAGAGGGSGPYVATHYVAHYSQVAGASSDQDVQDAAAFAAATSESTPCTAYCALANAAAGHKVQWGPGIMVGPDTTVRYAAAFASANSGASGNPIIHFAKYPAATNPNNQELWTEIRRVTSNEQGCAMSNRNGGTMTNYVIFDGFAALESVTKPGRSNGIFCLSGNGSTTGIGCELRRILVDRSGVANYAGGYNANCVYVTSTIDARTVDCRFFGTGTITGQNAGAYEVYNSIRPICEYSSFINCGHGAFVKTEAPTDPGQMDDAEVRYCYFDTLSCVHSQTSRRTLVHHNLIKASQRGMRWASTAANNQINCPVEFYSNTIILAASGTEGAITFQGASLTDGTDDWRDNILYVHGAGNGYLCLFNAYGGAPYAQISDLGRFNYNCYYDTSGPRWFDQATTYTVFAGGGGWQEHMATYGTDAYGGVYDANSIYSDPQFVDFNGGDYRLASNGQAALTASSTGGPVGCYITGTEERGVRASPTY